MKRIKYLASAFLLLACIFGCEEVGRLDQPDNSDYVPGQPSVGTVTSIPGGAVIKYSLPADRNIRGVKVVYERNGEICENMSSRYSDSLKVEGLSDTYQHSVQVYAIGKNERLSQPVEVSFTPEPPTILTAQIDMSEVFGGVRMHLSGNDFGSDLAVVLIQDTVLFDEGKAPGEMEWTDVQAFHTSLNNVDFTRRDLPPETSLFGAYVRDRWGNCSDTVYTKLTPIEEIELPRVNQWQLYPLPGDEVNWLQMPQTLYELSHLFDGRADGNQYCAIPAYGTPVKWITIDMGYVAKFSRHRLLGRLNQKGFEASQAWHWQIWGSMNPNLDGSWDDSWYLLGDFEQYKPSGLLPDGSGYGTCTDEDLAWMKQINEYDFVITDDIPDPYRECRYIRLKLIDNATTFFTTYDVPPSNITYFMGELIMYGSIVK